MTHTQEELQAGKAKWEGRTDKSLVDFLNSNLGHSYRHLNRLLQVRTSELRAALRRLRCLCRLP